MCSLLQPFMQLTNVCFSLPAAWMLIPVPSAVTSFRGLWSLRHLWLDENILTEVPVSTLSTLTELRALSLALNTIGYVPDRAFASLRQLLMLYVTRVRDITKCFLFRVQIKTWIGTNLLKPHFHRTWHISVPYTPHSHRKAAFIRTTKLSMSTELMVHR